MTPEQILAVLQAEADNPGDGAKVQAFLDSDEGKAWLAQQAQGQGEAQK
jgi:hypothetical protein